MHHSQLLFPDLRRLLETTRTSKHKCYTINRTKHKWCSPGYNIEHCIQAFLPRKLLLPSIFNSYAVRVIHTRVSVFLWTSLTGLIKNLSFFFEIQWRLTCKSYRDKIYVIFVFNEIDFELSSVVSSHSLSQDSPPPWLLLLIPFVCIKQSEVNLFTIIWLRDKKWL